MAKRTETKAKGHKVVKPAGSKKLTLGDLIAAAYDAVGNEVKDVARVLGSRQLSHAIHRRIVVV